MKFHGTLVGVQFRPIDAQLAFRDLEIGTTLALERDPDNAFDANAVKVLAADQWIGFIDRDTASLIAQSLDMGSTGTAILLSKAKRGGQLEIILNENHS